jgi:hypothetical protein
MLRENNFYCGTFLKVYCPCRSKLSPLQDPVNYSFPSDFYHFVGRL